MNAIVVGPLVFVLLLASVAFGVALSRWLPPSHLDRDSRDAIRVATAVVGTLSALALGAPPLTGGAVCAFLSGSGSAPGGAVIDDTFVCEVQALMKPGTSALFVLDRANDMAEILRGIRGLGGTVLKTNVDLERAQLIQSTLATAEPAEEGQ